MVTIVLLGIRSHLSKLIGKYVHMRSHMIADNVSQIISSKIHVPS